MRKIFLLACFCMSILLAFAQTRTVTGKVTDDKGNSLAGVNVTVKGTTTATQTKDDGTFMLVTDANAKVLVVTAVGMGTREITIGQDNSVSVRLTPQASDLQEVVVTALGLARDKRSLGYATQSLKAEQLADKGEVNLVNALQGRVAGVNITQASGGAGASTNINIRGITSFNGNNQPLFIVDGIPISNNVDRTNGGTLGTLGDAQPPNRAIDLDLNNIETINILKGPAASVLYGSRAAAGAIVITTKKGGSGRGKTEIIFNSSYSVQRASGLAEMQNEYGQGLNGVYNPISGNSWGPRFGTTPTVANGLLVNGVAVPYQPYPNNIQNFYEEGTLADNSLLLNGGDLNQNYTFSIGNVGQRGIIPNSSFARTNVKFGGNATLRGKIKVGGSISYINTRQVGPIQGNGSSATGQLVNVTRSTDLDFWKNNYKKADGTNNWYIAGSDNPYFDAYENPIKSNLTRFLGNLTLGYDLTSWMNISYRLGVDAYTDRRKQIFAVSSARVPAGQVLEDIFYRNELNGDLLITMKKNGMFHEDLNVNALLGHNVNQRRFQNVSLQGDALTIPGYYNINNATVLTNGSGELTNLQRLIGYYGQLSFGWRDFLFLEFTGRVDQSSTLPKDKNTYFYPSVNTSFVFTDAFKVNSNFLSYGKIRASVAKVGRDANPYLLSNFFIPGAFGNNVASFNFPINVGTSTLSGFRANTTIASPSLSPEFTTSYEGGINLGLFNNKLNIDVAYFDQRSKDQIVAVALAPSTGFAAQTTNIGEMRNKGVEVMVNATVISTKDWRWDVSGNYTQIRNKVISIAPGITQFQITGNAFTGSIPSIVVGQPYGVIVGSKFPRSPDGQFIINPSTGLWATGIAGQVLADPNPDYTVGLSNTLKYKKFNFSVLVDYQHGGQFVSFTAAFLRSRGVLKETAVDRELPRIIPGVIQQTDGKFVPNTIQIPAQTYWQNFGAQSDLNVYDASVLRLREISISYDFPSTLTQKIRINGARLGIFARNVWFYAPNSPIDPAVNTQGAGNIRGLELQSAPNTRSIGANLRLSL